MVGTLTAQVSACGCHRDTSRLVRATLVQGKCLGPAGSVCLRGEHESQGSNGHAKPSQLRGADPRTAQEPSVLRHDDTSLLPPDPLTEAGPGHEPHARSGAWCQPFCAWQFSSYNYLVVISLLASMMLLALSSLQPDER